MRTDYCEMHYARKYRHGDVNYVRELRSKTPTHISWSAMKGRCNNPNDPSYCRYGGRGIKYDTRWDVYDNFLQDMGKRPKGMTLDRIDSNGDYSKDNCRWANSFTQTNNRTSNVYIEYGGKYITITEWSLLSHIPRHTLYRRYYKHISVNNDFKFKDALRIEGEYYEYIKGRISSGDGRIKQNKLLKSQD